jgi:hypothetical protein
VQAGTFAGRVWGAANLGRLYVPRRHLERRAQAAEDRLFPNIVFLLPPGATPSEYIAARKEVIAGRSGYRHDPTGPVSPAWARHAGGSP